MTQLPFRWNLARRQQLGSLLHGNAAEAYRGFFGDLRECCVRVVAAAGDAELVFIGRSPESIFDYLSGALAGTSWSGRAVLVSFSMRYDDPAELARTHPAVLRAIREQLAAQGLAPADLARGERPTTLVDLVYAGRTFGRLLALLEHWAQEEGTDLS